MKYFFVFLLVCTIRPVWAQKYILLDKSMSRPAFYSNQISVSEKYKGFFPVPSNEVNRFLQILKQIAEELSSKKIPVKAKTYEVGCIRFKGEAFPLANGGRLDYVLTSTCDGKKVTMHLVDARIDFENNAYFVNTWIKYIKHAIKSKK